MGMGSISPGKWR